MGFRVDFAGLGVDPRDASSTFISLAKRTAELRRLVLVRGG